jgi:hypothetical protein
MSTAALALAGYALLFRRSWRCEEPAEAAQPAQSRASG